MAMPNIWVEPCGCAQRDEGGGGPATEMAHVLLHCGPARRGGFTNETNFLYSDSRLAAPGWDADGAPVE